MNALIWILVIVAIYFVLKQFDPKKEKEDNVSDASPTEPKLNPNAEVQVLKFFCIKDKRLSCQRLAECRWICKS